MPTDTPESLRAEAERLLEHYPGEHATIDALAASGLVPHRHDTRRALLASADALEVDALEWAKRNGKPGEHDDWATSLLAKGHAIVGFNPIGYRLTEAGRERLAVLRHEVPDVSKP